MLQLFLCLQLSTLAIDNPAYAASFCCASMLQWWATLCQCTKLAAPYYFIAAGLNMQALHWFLTICAILQMFHIYHGVWYGQKHTLPLQRDWQRMAYKYAACRVNIAVTMNANTDIFQFIIELMIVCSAWYCIQVART